MANNSIINNEYFPKDTSEILNKLSSFTPENNFFYLFNAPDIKYEKELKIRINEKTANFKWDLNWIEQIINRRHKVLEILQNSGYHVITHKAVCRWRFIIGLGSSHPQETSMTLHHIYGFPFIPGSAIKGITSHYVSLSKGENSDKIFGSQEKKGNIIFFDALPVGEITLKLDIMNPHYQGYYSGNQAPADWQQPIPIKFLTVEKTKYEFTIAGRDKNLVDLAHSYLKQALVKHGLGAKTSLGYGIFEQES